MQMLSPSYNVNTLTLQKKKKKSLFKAEKGHPVLLNNS